MSDSLLTTKLYIPPFREDGVPRPHLTDRLLAGTGRAGCFGLLSSPAGTGKTTLLSEFVSRIQQPVAWLSLDEGDNDLNRFWSYLVAAFQSDLDRFGGSVLELLRRSQQLPGDTLPTLLLNEIADREQSIVLILDDYHEIHSEYIHTGLQFLIDHLPQNLYIVISTRIDPPFPLARYRARNQMIELRNHDLRFSGEETTKFLHYTMGLEMPDEDAAALGERTEGWAAGLQLAGLSLQGQRDVHAFIQEFTGSTLYVAEYLLEEVLRRQTEGMRTFLVQTSILSQMNGSLCEAVTHCPDGQTMLQTLHRSNTFLIPLDRQGEWFRYHHLFADLLHSRLKQELSTDEIADLHSRAANWYDRNDLPSEAVRHALAAGDFEKAANLIDMYARSLIYSGQISVLRGWLEGLPDTLRNTQTKLRFYQFWIDALQGKADLSEPALQEMEVSLATLPSTPDNNRLRGELMSVICRAIALSGRTARGIQLAREALALLPSDDYASLARTNSALAITLDLEGHTEEASPVYQRCFSQAAEAGEYRLLANTMMVKGLVQIHYGKLSEAEQTFREIIDLGERKNNSPPDRAVTNVDFFPAGQGYLGLGNVHLEWNDLQTAETYLQRGIDLCHRGGLDGVFIGRELLSRLRQARGDLVGALEEIRHPEQGGPRVDDINIIIRRILIEVDRENVDAAWELASPLAELLESDAATERIPLLFLERLQAAVARVYLSRGEFENALRMADKLQSTARPGNRIPRLIEADLIRALALLEQSDGKIIPGAVKALEHALELAEPQEYVLVFKEAGPGVILLLRAVLDNPSASDTTRAYAQNLFDDFSVMVDTSPVKANGEVPGIVEQLTPREMEVLELLATGDTNQAIAEKLVITVRTVKKHASNIYGKLNVDNRTQAVARARDLGLLSTD